MIRLATTKDLSGISSLVTEFSELKTGDVKFETDKVNGIITKCIENETVLALEVGGKVVGGHCAIVVDSLMNNEVIYQDMFFYIRKPYVLHTRSLLRGIERRCVAVGANTVVMATMGDNPRLDKLYKIMGYGIMETHHSKRVA